MLYQRSLEIETRLDTALGLIRTGLYSTPGLARQLGVSIPTVSRCVTALRARGHIIQAERGTDGWRYVLQIATASRPGKSRTRAKRKPK